MQSYVKTVTSLSKEKKVEDKEGNRKIYIYKRNIEGIKIVSNHQLLKLTKEIPS